MMKTANVFLVVAIALNAAACSGQRTDLRGEPDGGAKSNSPAATVAPVQSAEVPKPALNLDEPKAKEVAPKAKEIAAPKAKVNVNAPIAIKRLVVSRGVENREPIAAAETFSIQDGTRLYAFVEVDNPSLEETEINVSFETPDGRSRGAIPLHVGPGARWRTWAQTRFADVEGTWTVSVRDAKGVLLCQTMFEMAGS